MCKALYGHPLAGLYWEKHCRQILLDFGWEPVKGWECLYVHRQEKLFLSVYVDDFKMSGVAENLAPVWENLRTKMDLDLATPLSGGVCLGCGQYDIQTPVDLVREKQELYNYILDDGSFDSQKQVDTSNRPNRKPSKGRRKGSGAPSGVAPASLPETAQPQDVQQQVPDLKQVRAWEYVMQGHAQKVVEKYCELAGVKENQLRHVVTPNLDDHAILPQEFEDKGQLEEIAARVGLTALYLARYNRSDLLWTVNQLARDVTRWTGACDRRLHRLISYIHHHLDFKQIAYVGDSADRIRLALFVVVLPAILMTARAQEEHFCF